MIDSHCHLADRKFDRDLEEVIARARAFGVTTLVTIADDVKEAKKCIDIAKNNEHIFYTTGVHPHNADAFSDNDLEQMKEMISDPKCVAIGECGLDYHYMNSKKDRQIAAFRAQLELANDMNMPVVVHTRDAIEDTWNIIDKLQPEKIVVHCCTEKWEDVQRFVERGYLLSFTGIATYPKSTDIQNTIKHCPIEQMMIETDAPYLSPQSKRGKRNEPAFVVEVAELIADTKQMSLQEVDRITTENAERFYEL